ncbi:MAG: mechanosensitive ion channel family protein, partial [Phocaeicola sp.]
GIIMGLKNAGYDVGAVIAGLGIVGLAVAMAAKDTVSNFFGGVTIFSDKPFRIGDRIKIGSYDGFIHEIGLRSFRLRTLNGTIVTIPNSKVTDSLIENVTLEPSRKVTLNLGLTYETSPEKVKEAIEILRDIASLHTSLEENIVVSFNQYGDFSLGILFIYYIKKGEDILQAQTDINLSILTRFNERKIQFAYPTQTLYVNNQC